MFKYKVEQIRVSTDSTDEALKSKIAKTLDVLRGEIISIKIIRSSLDARKEHPIRVICAEVALKKPLAKQSQFVKEIRDESEKQPSFNVLKGITRPAIIGFGPAGICAAYVLAKRGAKPIVFERGEDVSNRKLKAEAFWNDGILDENSNVLFGEGGAGLFSDGKLTSRSKDLENRDVFLNLLVRHGAQKSILTDAKAHIGSDVLTKIVQSIRSEIAELGGEIKFSSRLTDIKSEGGKLAGVLINGELFDTKTAVIATGHSAKDTYKTVAKHTPVEAKSFAIGLRVEIDRELIDRLRYGNFSAKLPAADFNLAVKADEKRNIRACYTFCMCPGGRVIACSAQKGLLNVNGMSYSTRDMKYSNAAFLVPVAPEDFCNGKKSQLDCALDFLSAIERKTFEKGGGDYSVPVQTLSSYIYGMDKKLNFAPSSHRYLETDLRGVLPDFVENTLKITIPSMLKSLGGIDLYSVAVSASETGSSSAIRIVRDSETMQSPKIAGLFPCGEGAGYAGGIVSSAIDGIKCAKIIN